MNTTASKVNGVLDYNAASQTAQASGCWLDQDGSALDVFSEAMKNCAMCGQQPPGPRHVSAFGAGPFCDSCWDRYQSEDVSSNKKLTDAGGRERPN